METPGIISSVPDSEGNTLFTGHANPNVTQPGTISGAPGQGGGAAPAAAMPGSTDASAATPQPTIEWLVYTDPQYGFSLTYPDAYALLPPSAENQIGLPGMLYRVAFLDKVLINAATHDLEPPQFSVEVFERPANTTLEEWLDASGLPGNRTPVQIGKYSGYLLALNTMQAPNQFFYLMSDSYIFRLVPMGSYSDQMLQSFTLN